VACLEIANRRTRRAPGRKGQQGAGRGSKAKSDGAAKRLSSSTM
jgi:hypothetical protein